MTNELIMNKVLVEKVRDIGFLLDFDCDFNGTNGKEYTSNEALEKGFESDLDYALSEVEGKTLEEAVEIVINHFCSLNDSHYLLEYTTHKIGDSLLVVTCYKSIDN